MTDAADTYRDTWGTLVDPPETADERQAAIVAWLRGEQNQNEVINLTLAMRNSAVRATMNKCADILESGELKGQG